ncbi:hypothetical protein GCM10028805_19910 [Spirosoma harenae]
MLLPNASYAQNQTKVDSFLQLNEQIKILNGQGNFGQALKMVQKVLNIAQGIGETYPTYPVALAVLANAYFHTGQYGEALPWLEKALDVYAKRSGKQSAIYATILNNIGVIYTNTSLIQTK